jgi:hypothetical protein
VQVDKQTIIDFLSEQGDQSKVQEAESQLPEQVDTERDSDLLDRLGIDPSALMGRLGGGNIPGL